MTISELSVFLLIFRSDDSKNAYYSNLMSQAWRDTSQQVESILIQQSKHISPYEFGKICVSIDEDIIFQKFLRKLSNKVIKWSQNSQLSLDELPYIMRSFSLSENNASQNDKVKFNEVL